MQTNPPRQVPSTDSMYHPIDRAGFALGCVDKLYRPLHIRMTSSVVTEPYFFPELEDLGLPVWLMTVKAKACILVFKIKKKIKKNIFSHRNKERLPQRIKFI